MRISSFNTYQPYFRSSQAPNYGYRVEPFNPYIDVHKDDDGHQPALVFDDAQKKMHPDGDGFYRQKLDPKSNAKFSILDNGDTFGPYSYNYDDLSNTAVRALQQQRGIPRILTFSDKKPVRGKLMFVDEFSNMGYEDFGEPIILVHTGKGGEVVGGSIPVETVGYLPFPGAFDGRFSHGAQRYKQMLDQVHLLIDENDRNELLRLGNGQIVEVGVKDSRFYVKPVDKNGKLPERPTIPIPHLRYCDKILTSKECTPDVIGNKAVNLRKLEKMAEEGKINAVIPPFIALPEGFLKYFDYHDLYNKYGFELVKRIINYIDGNMPKKCTATPEEMELHKDVVDAVTKRIQLHNKYTNKMYSKLMKTAKENGVVGTVIFRSCFNDEDLPYFANAGGYTSIGGGDLEEYKADYGAEAGFPFAWDLDQCVLISKYHNGPKELRRAFHIPEEDIQVGAIIQKEILTDKKFTIYTDDGSGDLKIDLKIKPNDDEDDSNRVILSHMFTYHRDTGELTYDTMQTEKNTGVNFDMDSNITSIDPANDLSGDEELFELLKSIAEDAIKVEKELGAPQDVEGCVIPGEDGSKYNGYAFVQSRNIVR